jgi:hypothetical protein
LLRPAPYNERLHRLAERQQAAMRLPAEPRGPRQHPAYQILVDSTVLDPTLNADGWLRLKGVTASPWSILVIESL